MKKSILLITLSAIVFSMAGCGLLASHRVDTISSVSFYDYIYAGQNDLYINEVEAETTDLYFHTREEVPYLEVGDFLEISSSMFEDDAYNLRFTTDGFTVTTSDLLYSLEYDYTNQTIHVNHYEFFGYLQEQKAYEIDYFYLYEDTSSRVINASDSITIDLTEYQMEGVKKDGNYTLPLSLLNLLFSAHESGIYFNGSALYSVHYQDVYTTEIYIGANNFFDMPETLQTETLYYLALYFDYFYGLNTSTSDGYYLDQIVSDYIPDLTGDTQDFYQTIDFMLKDFDDMHLWMDIEGYYGESYTFDDKDYEYFGRSLASSEAATEYEDYCLENKSGLLATGIATFVIPEFGEYTPDTFAYEYDMYVDETTTDIIIDLSCNYGGFVSSVLDLLPYFIDGDITVYESNFKYHSNYEFTYQSNIDKIPQNVYIKTSEMSYSAANIFASIIKSNGAGQIIGTQSTGGSSYTDTIFAPGGILITSPTQYHFTDVNNIYYEFGTPVDFEIPINDEYSIMEYILSQHN